MIKDMIVTILEFFKEMFLTVSLFSIWIVILVYIFCNDAYFMIFRNATLSPIRYINFFDFRDVVQRWAKCENDFEKKALFDKYFSRK